MKSVIILTAGGHGRSTLDVLKQSSGLEVVGFLDDTVEAHTLVCGIPVLGGLDKIPELIGDVEFVVGLGKIGGSLSRRHLAERCWEAGGKLITASSPHAYVSSRASLGEGTVVHHGATVNIAAEIGRNCIVNSHALVEHDAVVGDHCHVATGAILNGNCVVGQDCFIGSGAVLHHRVTLAPGTVVAAGQIVSASILP